ncbi:MAG: LPXTG cell wall anchor domain-containing protein [Actinobacteria bacterium]|nr:LPXTG cell wall anchor domain-containing protein [Actinomycetota bacterium]
MARRLALTLAGALVALLSLAGVASAQQYPTQQGTLQTNQTAARPGEPITVSGGGFAPNSTVTINFDTQVLGTTTTRPAGDFTTTVTIPANATPGAHTLAAVGTGANGAPRRLTSTVQVLGTTAQRDGGLLPRTGDALTPPLAASAALLIGAGSVAVVATRRRRA